MEARLTPIAATGANGSVFTQCKPRHRHQEFLSFLRHIEANVPERLDVHLIVDNYGTHKHAKVRAWLARRPRFHRHFTPTYSSWLNLARLESGTVAAKFEPFVIAELLQDVALRFRMRPRNGG